MRIPISIRILLLLAVVVAPQLIGCSNFFVPVCEETNTCPPTLTGITPSSGSSGTSVTLTGTFLTGATGVSFSGTAATSFVINSSTQVTAVAPSGSGTVLVDVTTPGGTTNGESFTYGSSGSSTAPSLTNISPSSGSSGTTVALTGTNLTGTTAVKFGSNAASSFTVVSATEVTAVAPSGSGTVSVTVTTPDGTSNGVSFSYGSSSTTSYIYVANGNAGNVAGFTMNGSVLDNLPSSPYSLNGGVPTAMATTPDGAFLYVGIAAGAVYVYAIGSSGALTPGNNGSPVENLNVEPTYMAVDRKSNFLFIGSNTSPQMYEYQINTGTGVLTAPAGNTQGFVTLHGAPEQIYVTPNNQYIYVGETPASGAGVGGIDVFTLNSSTGALSNALHANSKNTALYADEALVSDSNSKFLFAGETGCSCVRAFTIGSGGALSEVSGSPFSAPTGPSALAVDPTNTYLYVGSKTSSEISGYQLGSSGALTPMSSSPFLGAGVDPVAMALDESNTYLFVAAGQGNPDLEVFSFDATTAGKLDPVSNAKTGSTDPTNPVAMSITK